MSKFKFDIAITLTASKTMSFMILIMGAWLGATTFMFAVPFASALVLGKQYFDKNKEFPQQ